MFSKNQPCLQRNVDKGNTWWIQSYYIKDVTGAIHNSQRNSIFYVPELQQDLLAGTALLNAGYPVILENDPKIAVNFPVTNGEIDPATGVPFLDSKGLFLLKFYQFLTQYSKYVRICVVASTTWTLSNANDR